MDTIHGMNRDTLPRHVVPALSERLRVMPAVVVTGARQTGKSTLAEVLIPGKRRFLSLDDPTSSGWPGAIPRRWWGAQRR
jgi:uncharacterized protein